MATHFDVRAQKVGDGFVHRVLKKIPSVLHIDKVAGAQVRVVGSKVCGLGVSEILSLY